MDTRRREFETEMRDAFAQELHDGKQAMEENERLKARIGALERDLETATARDDTADPYGQYPREPDDYARGYADGKPLTTPPIRAPFMEKLQADAEATGRTRRQMLEHILNRYYSDENNHLEKSDGDPAKRWPWGTDGMLKAQREHEMGETP